MSSKAAGTTASQEEIAGACRGEKTQRFPRRAPAPHERRRAASVPEFETMVQAESRRLCSRHKTPDWFARQGLTHPLPWYAIARWNMHQPPLFAADDHFPSHEARSTTHDLCAGRSFRAAMPPVEARLPDIADVPVVSRFAAADGETIIPQRSGDVILSTKPVDERRARCNRLHVDFTASDAESASCRNAHLSIPLSLREVVNLPKRAAGADAQKAPFWPTSPSLALRRRPRAMRKPELLVFQLIRVVVIASEPRCKLTIERIMPIVFAADTP